MFVYKYLAIEKKAQLYGNLLAKFQKVLGCKRTLLCMQINNNVPQACIEKYRHDSCLSI
jgi:hypothetical protein